mmetsp:Transcript_10616/g.31355  ORF Transcript_10616/g.31355 Transcript_10616/m.31355 type:complete len:246 (-) Transcript_10616:168-905(-)
MVQRRHVEIIIGILHIRVGVGTSPVPTQERLVLLLVGVLLRPQKQHVLVKVGQSRTVGGILKVSRAEVDGPGLNVRGRVGHEEGDEGVGEADGAVRAAVREGLEEGRRVGEDDGRRRLLFLAVQGGLLPRRFRNDRRRRRGIVAVSAGGGFLRRGGLRLHLHRGSLAGRRLVQLRQWPAAATSADHAESADRKREAPSVRGHGRSAADRRGGGAGRRGEGVGAASGRVVQVGRGEERGGGRDGDR